MKTIKHLSAALVSVLLLAGAATQANAMEPEWFPALSPGDSTTHVSGGKTYYRINVEDANRLRIHSQVWPGESSNAVRLNGRLLDANGQVVAEGRRMNGQFVLDQNVAPGEYILELRGSQFGGRTEGANHYYLTTDML